MGLDFTLEEEAFGRRVTRELRPNGAEIAVTNANKLLYVHLVADHHLNERIGAASTTFATGLSQVRERGPFRVPM